MVFRLTSAQFFLTYPQCNLPLEEVYNHLINLKPKNIEILKIVVAEEKHESGEPHLHAYLKYKQIVNLSGPAAEKTFDINSFHPNVQGARSAKQVIEYVTKGGNYKSNFEIKGDKKRKLQEYLNTSKSSEEFINKVISDDITFATRSFINLRAFADHVFKNTGKTYDPIRPFDSYQNPPQGILQFKLQLEFATRGDRNMRSLWLYGASKTGKTQLTRSLGRHGYMQSIWNLECITDKCEYFIFDDINWDTIKWNYKALLGSQTNINLTGKYKKPITLEWGIPAIIITNEKPDFTGHELSWLEKNVNFILIDKNLY